MYCNFNKMSSLNGSGYNYKNEISSNEVTSTTKQYLSCILSTSRNQIGIMAKNDIKLKNGRSRNSNF